MTQLDRLVRSAAAMSVLATIVTLGAHSHAHATSGGGLIVPTPTGFFRGVSTGGMRQWRGVPYAKAPVGSRRLAPPQPTGFLHGLRDATAFGSMCPQPIGWDEETEQAIVGGSEDCLFLNVSVPRHAHLLSFLPVVVHLHGGGNIYGEGRQDPSAFVERGVIVVTLNYRLGALGWMAHPALSAEQGGHSSNYGSLDQIAALTWVRNNILFFGGNPLNVTLSGFSAGAFDAQALAASPLARGLFHKLASQAVSRWAVQDQYNDLVFLEQFGSTGVPEWGVAGIQHDVGCGDAEDVLECLRSVPFERFAAPDYGQWFPATDGYLLPKTVVETIQDSGGHTVPMIVGSNREEDAGILVFDIPEGFGDDDYAAWTKDLVFGYSSYPEGTLDDAQLEAKGAQLRAAYPSSDYPSAGYAYMILETDVDKTCPTRRFALASNAPVYRYLYTHVFEDLPDYAPFLSFHGSEEDMLWHEEHWYAPHEWSAEDERLSARMSTYWTNFARTGNPNGAGLPQWPRFTPKHERHLELAHDVRARSGGYHAAQCEIVEDVLWPHHQLGD